MMNKIFLFVGNLLETRNNLLCLIMTVFQVMVVGGSFGLQQFAQLRYTFRKSKKVIFHLRVRTHRTRQNNCCDIGSNKILFVCTPNVISPVVLSVFRTFTDPNIKQHTLTFNERDIDFNMFDIIKCYFHWLYHNHRFV